MTEDQATVFVIDDDISVRDSLESVIRWAGWKARTFSSAHEFLSRPESDGPCCIVLDVDLPDLNGLELQKRIGDRLDMPIIFITGVGDIPMSVRAMKAGAVEFLTKPLSDQVVLDAMRQAIERSRAARIRHADSNSLRERYASLTNRQREVMSLVISGLLNKEVGAKLGMSEVTVKVHRGKVMRKMKADSLTDLVRMAARLELPLTKH